MVNDKKIIGARCTVMVSLMRTTAQTAIGTMLVFAVSASVSCTDGATRSWKEGLGLNDRIVVSEGKIKGLGDYVCYEGDETPSPKKGEGLLADLIPNMEVTNDPSSSRKSQFSKGQQKVPVDLDKISDTLHGIKDAGKTCEELEKDGIFKRVVPKT